MCDTCDWEGAVRKARDVLDVLPQWMTKKRDFIESVVESIENAQHATDRQKEVIEQIDHEVAERV